MLRIFIVVSKEEEIHWSQQIPLFQPTKPKYKREMHHNRRTI